MARIVVCGAGVVGLSAAMLLAKDGHEVTVVERDAAAPPEPAAAWDGWERRGVGQFRLPHFLLPGFRKVVEAELPEVVAALEAAGALRMNPLGPFAEAMDPAGENDVLTARRPLVEAAVASVAERTAGLTIRRGVALAGVAVAGAGVPPRVVGVRSEAGEEIRADLVVDALGRRSPMARWLGDAGGAPPEVEEEDSGFVYYGRHVRTADGTPLPATLRFWGSVGLLVLPAEAGVTGVGVIGWSGDAPLRALRHVPAWEAVVALLPHGPEVLAGAPVEDDVLVMAGIEDRIRRYVVDGRPVATGVVPVGDAWAATNPTLGRGISLGARHARLLRDLLREVEPGDHEKLALRFDEETQTHQTPWYRSTVWHDRHRTGDFQAAISGVDAAPDPLWDRFLAYDAAACTDLTLLPHFLSTFRLDRRPEEVIADPEVVAHMDAAGLRPPTELTPTRRQVLSAIAAAQ